MAPVSAPLVMEFQGSSFPLRRTKPQSMVEKSPPHTAKLPAKSPKISCWLFKNMMMNDELQFYVQCYSWTITIVWFQHLQQTKQFIAAWEDGLTPNLWRPYSHSICTPPQSVSHTLKHWTLLKSTFKKLTWHDKSDLTAGALRKPFTAWKTPPPITPIEKAPPQSSTILQGLHEQKVMKKVKAWSKVKVKQTRMSLNKIDYCADMCN